MEREMAAINVVVALMLTAYIIIGASAAPSVIIVGAGMSGISAAKTLSDAGMKDLLILEATDRIGGRIHKTKFAGLNVEMGANWVEGVHGREMNPIWEMVNKLNLRTFFSDYNNLSSNSYMEGGGLYQRSVAQKVIDLAENINESGEKISSALPASGREDISILTYQRLKNHVPSTPLEMAVDYYLYDYEFAEPPRVTSLQNTVPLATFANFGEDLYFVADQRGYESVVYDLAKKFLLTNNNIGTIVDPRLKLNKVH